MKYCAQCQNSFSDSVDVCPNDGSSLIETDPGSEAKTLYKTESSSQTSSRTGFNENAIIGQTIDGKYQVQALLGVGGMGAVFRARHSFIKNDVAIKLIHPNLATDSEIAERFLREARAAAMIDHPNAIKVTDFGRAGDMLYLVMEFIQGHSLTDLIRKRKYLTPDVTAGIMVQVCAALDVAHSSNIIHRDLKPDNIMLKQNNRGQLVVKVLDFGIAKINSVETSRALTGEGVILGTLDYMSPEQCRGDEVIDLRSDIYSLGIVAFEMLTGRVPFEAATPMGLVASHIVDAPPTLRSIMPDIPEEVERVVLRALAKKPEERYSSAGEFAAELANAARCTAQASDAPGLFDDLVKGAPTAFTRKKDIGTDRKQVKTETSENLSRTAVTQVKPGEQPAKTDLESLPAPRRRAPLYAGLAVALLALALGGGYFALRAVNTKGPAPPGSQKIDAALPGMVLIQGGWMKMGSLEGYEDEQPAHDVWIDPFYMDETEVTNEQFQKFVSATGYITDAEKEGNQQRSWRAYATPDRSNHPVVLVSWNDAVAYAKWVGKRLPTEAEWEYAARGGLVGKKYPWGDDPPQRHTNFGHGQRVEVPLTEPVKSYEANGYGLYNMAGNVSEWCQDWYDEAYYRNSPERNPQGPSTGRSRVIRGGSWYTDFNQIRVVARISEFPEGYEYDRGFRCTKSR